MRITCGARPRITSDAGLLAYRELDDALGLTNLAGATLSECRQGKNTRHMLTGLLRQSVFGRLAGYEDVSDADRLAHDPAAGRGGSAGPRPRRCWKRCQDGAAAAGSRHTSSAAPPCRLRIPPAIRMSTAGPSEIVTRTIVPAIRT